MTYIANPIYDSVFKFMMEDERVARILLSALLKKDVVSVEMKQHEYTEITQSRISMLRLDFNARIRDNDGTENIILIELQKTWLVTETLRFRQYLGVQYLDKKNIPSHEVNPKGHAYPIVSIYILGHKLGDLEEPVVYVKRNYLDYDSNPIVNGVPDPFVESLTHDSIIVQIPFLRGRLRNRLERLLQIFDQDYCVEGNDHLLNIDENKFCDDEFLVIHRLIKAGASPEIKRAMDVEDQILSEIESRDTTIMLKEQEIEKKNQELQSKDQELQSKAQELQSKDQELQSKDQELQSKDIMIKNMVTLLLENGLSTEEIANRMNLPVDIVKSYSN